MAQIQRQNNFFAAEDFRTIYRTFSEINFTSYDFDSIKQSMIEYLQRQFPEEFNDFIESSEFIAIVELLAYMGQTIAFRQDLNTRENFLDTAERSESIRRLARMLNYVPKRNIPAAGLIKIETISTDEEIIDSAGNNLANQAINWNDPDNIDFLEQITLILNAVFLTQNPYGTPVKKGTVSEIPIELYTVDTVKNLAVIYTASGNVNGHTTPFEVVNGTFVDKLYFKEVEPNPETGINMFYLNDGLGNSSDNTGFFMYLKQGALSFDDFNLDTPIPNREIFLDKENINEYDVWVQSIDSNGIILNSWDKVPSISGNNIVYNSLLKNKRKIFTTISSLNDKVSIRFADGAFGDVPVGTTRIWYRQSVNKTQTVRPEDIGLQTIQIPYIGKNNTTQILSLTLGLTGSMSQSIAAESNLEIKTNAPQIFYTQDRMVNGEDYNTYPLYKNTDIIKIKAINRTHAGHSRFIDINDPTGVIQNLNVFAEDGFIYKDEQNIQATAELTAATTPNTIIQRFIQPQLSEDEVTNFYYDLYRKAVHTADGSGAWRFTTNELIKWVSLPSSTESSTGYFVGATSISIPTNFVTIGTTGIDKKKFLVEKALLEFQDVSRTTTKFATIENLSADGNPAGLSVGPVELNVTIPEGYEITRVYPKFRKIFNTTEQTLIFTQLNLKNTFGIGYDYKTSAFYVINPNNLSADTVFSLVNAQDLSNSNKDVSWIIKVEYKEATTLTNANYLITTRGLRYVFESEEEVRFYFDNSFKTIDVKTGQAKRDVITLLKVNSDKRSQIDRVDITNPGNGYTVSPIVSFQQTGEIDPAVAEAQLSWSKIIGGVGGQGYTPTDTNLTYLDSTVVDANGLQTEIKINNADVLDTSAGGRTIRLRANISAGATGVPVIQADRINNITLLDGGTGYTVPPTITIPIPADPGGTRAEAETTLSSQLSGVNLLDQGGGYNNVASVTFALPLFSGSTWRIKHALGKHINYEIINTSDNVVNGSYEQPVVTFIDQGASHTPLAERYILQVTWQTSTTGYVDIIKPKFVSALTEGNEWIIDHNLGQQFPNIEVIYADGVTDTSAQGRFDYPLIEYTSITQCKIKFPAAPAVPTDVIKSGYIVATHNNGDNSVVGSGYNYTQSSALAIWPINHNLGRRYVNVDIARLGSEIDTTIVANSDGIKYYNVRGLYDAPTINYVDDNNLTVTWLTTVAGIATISTGDGIGTPATGAVHMEVGDSVGTPTGCLEYTIANGGSNFVSATDVGDTITFNLPGTVGTPATATISSVSGGGAITGLTIVNRGDYTAFTSASASDSDSSLDLSAVTSYPASSGVTINLFFRVKSVILTNPGSEYQSLPTITISAPPGGTLPCVSRRAEGQATRLGNVVAINMTNTGAGYTTAELGTLNAGIVFTGANTTVAIAEVQKLLSSITEVTMLTAGTGYVPATPPLVTFTTAPTGGTTATGTAAVNASGNVTGITITNTGDGYTPAPIATFSGGGGVDAAATVNVNTLGQVNYLTITNAGTGYTSAPIIAITENTGSNATATASITSGAVSDILITNLGAGYTASPICTIANSGAIESINIIDPGYGYTSLPLITYGTATGGTGASSIIVNGFVSFVKVTDPGNGYTTDTTVTFSSPSGTDPLTALGTPRIKVNQKLDNDIKFNLSKLLTYADGYQDPRKVLITFNDEDGNGIPDDPLSFDRFVDVSRYLFEETYIDFDGYTYYKLSRNVIQTDSQAEENLIITNASTYAGKYVYRTDLKVFKKIAATAPYALTTLINDTDGTLKLAAFVGRSRYNTPKVNTSTNIIEASSEENIFFQWKHYAPADQRVDPSVTNLIDTFILTKTYYDKVLAWKANNKTMTEFPAPPTNTELSISFNNLNNYKSISDQIIYRPVKFKLLFGSQAAQELQANFKVIKTIGSDISDNELKSKVIAAINRFFLLSNWDLGESFYYTELAAFIHSTMPTNIGSVALVPTQSESNFGNLFQVKAEVNELFLPVAKVTDIEVVKGFTEQNLKIK